VNVSSSFVTHIHFIYQCVKDESFDAMAAVKKKIKEDDELQVSLKYIFEETCVGFTPHKKGYHIQSTCDKITKKFPKETLCIVGIV